jgi:hypothetical protein
MRFDFGKYHTGVNSQVTFQFKRIPTGVVTELTQIGLLATVYAHVSL